MFTIMFVNKFINIFCRNCSLNRNAGISILVSRRYLRTTKVTGILSKRQMNHLQRKCQKAARTNIYLQTLELYKQSFGNRQINSYSRNGCVSRVPLSNQLCKGVTWIRGEMDQDFRKSIIIQSIKKFREKIHLLQSIYLGLKKYPIHPIHFTKNPFYPIYFYLCNKNSNPSNPFET